MAEIRFGDHVDLEGSRRVKSLPAPAANTDADRPVDRDAAIAAAVAGKLGPATGTPDGSKFLRDDLSWQTVSATVPDADGSTKGKVQLAGDLGGTAAAPTVPGLAAKADTSALTAHTSDTANPHTVTKAQVGLGSVTDDVQLRAADLDTDSAFTANSDTRVPSQKAVKTAVDGKASTIHSHAQSDVTGLAAALAGKADSSALTTHTSDTANPHSVTKTQVGLGSVTNDAQLKAADLDTDSAFTANSDTRIPSQKAVKTAVDGKLSAAGDTTTGAIRFTPVALTDAATIAVDAQDGNTFEVTLGGNRTLGTPSNPPGAGEAQEFRVYVKQDATGGRTLGYSSAFEFSTDLPVPVVTPAANAVDVLAFRYRAGSGKWLLIGINQGFGDV